jgi:hypothetical protein
VRIKVKPGAKTLVETLKLRGGGGSAVQTLRIPRS